jgi:hypothetical protein
LGFLLGGLWHFKDDPGLGILLVPVGALLLLATALHLGWSARSENSDIEARSASGGPKQIRVTEKRK